MSKRLQDWTPVAQYGELGVRSLW